jgi:hypothetical protein
MNNLTGTELESNDSFVKFLFLKWRCVLTLVMLLTLIINFLYVIVMMIVKDRGVSVDDSKLQDVMMDIFTLLNYTVFHTKRE